MVALESIIAGLVPVLTPMNVSFDEAAKISGLSPSVSGLSGQSVQSAD